MKTLDRYVVRTILPPAFLSFLAIGFVLEMPLVIDYGEKLIEKGVEWSTVVRLLPTLLPQAFGVTIPISLLLGILIGLGRMSADREFMALQSCGVSIFRVLRPIALLALLASGATAYSMIVAVPKASATFREIMFGLVAARVEDAVKPRAFFDDFPNRVLYVQDVLPDGRWRDVFVADFTQPGQTTVYFAERGQLDVDRETRTLQQVLENGMTYRTFTDAPEKYEGESFETLVMKMDVDTAFPKPTTLLKDDNELTIAELRAAIAEAERTGAPAQLLYFTIQQKFAIPVTCLVLALIAVGVGLTNRDDGKLAGFVLGFGVVLIEYFLLWTARALALGGRMSPTVAPWVANIVLGVAGVGILWWRTRSIDQSLPFSLPSFERRSAKPISLSPVGARWPSLLDRYVARQYLRVFVLGVFGLLGLFYTSDFMDLAYTLFRGTATTGMLLRYFYFETPRYIYFILPMAALIATLVVMAWLTRSNEIVVMRACGVSLYRTAVPVVTLACIFSGASFALEEFAIPGAHREAQTIRQAMRGLPPDTFGELDRRWVLGDGGEIYHYDSFDPGADRFSRLTVFRVERSQWRLSSLTYAQDAEFASQSDALSKAWQAHQGWTRQFAPGSNVSSGAGRMIGYSPFSSEMLSLERPSYFRTDEPIPDQMTYNELGRYVGQLRTSGFYVVPYVLQLHRKVAFPLATLIMTCLAIPFGASIGRSGALYGVGGGMVLAIAYWLAFSIFTALGSAGLMSPAMAAWAPNIMFGAAATYLVLTVRT